LQERRALAEENPKVSAKQILAEELSNDSNEMSDVPGDFNGMNKDPFKGQSDFIGLNDGHDKDNDEPRDDDSLQNANDPEESDDNLKDKDSDAQDNNSSSDKEDNKPPTTPAPATAATTPKPPRSKR
jgi:hypothetical protein